MSEKLKVAVLGCGGIIGQHMMISVPEGVEPLFVRKHPFPLSHALDLEDWDATEKWLDANRPDVIVNLAGESRPDVVERERGVYDQINVALPLSLSRWCDATGSHLVHVSSQAVFSGHSGRYEPNSLDGSISSVNEYGQQKRIAEYRVRDANNWTIVRPTFVLGIRPFHALGRENPAESILSGTQKWQVDNRWFSVSFAWDVAEMLWKTAQLRPKGRIVHCGNPERLSRYELARRLNPDGWFEAVTHEHLSASLPEPLAERPYDTTYKDAFFDTNLETGFEMLRFDYRFRAEDTIQYRAKELAAFLKHWTHLEALGELQRGFGILHNAVSEDFRLCEIAPNDEAGLLQWYRETEAYLWELTAYHCDAGFAYDKTCEGVITRLKADWAEKSPPSGSALELFSPYRVLCLGDGVGTLTIKMKEAGFDPYYHDLAESRTSAFAWARFNMRFPDPPVLITSHDFTPGFPYDFDAVVSLDYLEHVPNVEEWVRAVFAALRPGGLFCAQNGFNIGSGPDGAMPMHLAVNDHWEQDWDPMLARVGFVQESSNWYRKPL